MTTIIMILTTRTTRATKTRTRTATTARMIVTKCLPDVEEVV